MQRLNGSDLNGATQKHKWIGYRGNWYDITNFVKRHPGGSVIEKFVGHDATCVIDSMHKCDVLRQRKPVGTYTYAPGTFDRCMNKLEAKYKEEGYYDDSFWWGVRKSAFVMSLLALNVVFVCNGTLVSTTSGLMVSGVLLAFFWQQSGMWMHDLMHSQFTRDRLLDEKIGVFYGTLCFGLSARWWKDEHVIHHALTNTVDYTSNFVDPQAIEEVWAQNEKLFPYFLSSSLKRFCLHVQHWTFLPLTCGFGRIAIVVDSLRTERRIDVWIAWICHWVWLLYFLSFFPSKKDALIVYFIGGVGEGVLHIQLLLNHYAKKFYTLDEKHEEEYYRTMVDCNLNIITPWWLDWFHGGLNFHIEHHSFPRLPRNHLREVSGHIKKLCAKHNVHYDECGFFLALWRLLCHLYAMSKLFRKNFYTETKLATQ